MKERLQGYLSLLVLSVVVFFVLWPFSVTVQRWGYAMRYNTDARAVFIDEKPTNCEWTHAPLGSKGCHYEKQVVINRPTGPDPFASIPGERPITAVYVSWKKVEDR